MLRQDILEDCLIELPPFGSFPIRPLSKTVEFLLARDPDAMIYEDDDLAKKIIGLVYTMPSDRQIYVWVNGTLGLVYSEARYLSDSNKTIDVLSQKTALKPRSKLGQLKERLSREDQTVLRQIARWTSFDHKSEAA